MACWPKGYMLLGQFFRLRSSTDRELSTLMRMAFLVNAVSVCGRTVLCHPASDGLVERFSRTLLMMLTMFAGEHREGPKGLVSWFHSDTPDASATHSILGTCMVCRSMPGSAPPPPPPQCLVSGRNGLSSGFRLLHHIFQRRCLTVRSFPYMLRHPCPGAGT